MRFPVQVAILLIDGYKAAFSNHAPCCRFLPTCSDYARTSFEKHGFRTGLALSLRRILRCNPLGGHGYDPVPDKKSKDFSIHG